MTVLGVIGIIFSIAGGALIGKDIMKVAECNKEVQEYVAKGGKDTQGFNKQCIERKLKDKTSPSTISKVIDAPQVNITPSPTVVDKYKVSCEQNMRDYAQKNGVNPEQYIAQNQAYIEQCIQYYKSQDATPNKN